MKHAYSIIIDCGVEAPGHGREVVDGFNATEKRLILMLMTTVKRPGAESYESHMAMHTSAANTDISLARKFQKHLSDPA